MGQVVRRWPRQSISALVLVAALNGCAQSSGESTIHKPLGKTSSSTPMGAREDAPRTNPTDDLPKPAAPEKPPTAREPAP